MKIKIIKIFLALLALSFAACEPIEDRATLENSFDFDQLELKASQSTTGGNQITLKVETKGVNGFWDINIGKVFSDEVTFVYPIPGKSTFTYYVSTPYMTDGDPGKVEFFKSKTIEVQVDVLDHPLPDAYYKLVGANLEGKTWVFKKDNPVVAGGGPLWWYMVANDNPDGWQGPWWNAAGTCCPPADQNGEMTFDLNGAANYTYKDGNGNTVNGSFVLDTDNNKLKFVDAPILGNDATRTNANNLYQIVMLDDENLALYTNINAGGTGWAWWFKVKPSAK